MADVESRTRARVTSYTSALIVAVSSSVFLAVVPFLPAPPVVPLLVGLGLGALSLKNRGMAVATLYLLVYFSILWQLIGFGFFQLLSAQVGLAVILAMAVPLVPFTARRVELSSMALGVLAVALMLTPAYFVSIPLIAAAALAFGGFASLEALAATFVLFLTPLLLLENALYFTTTSGATAPIIFGQFSLLAQNLRPPLPGLNVLLTGLPADYLSRSSLEVSTWMTQSSGVLLIPMLILGVILVASSSIGGLTRTLIERFAKAREMTERVKLLFAPLVVAAVTPAVFILLLTLLSRPEAGGFQTSLTNDASHYQAAYMLGSSFLLTTSFIGREALVMRYETVQVGTDELDSLIDECLRKMEEARELIDMVAKRVPSMSLSGERQAITEHSSFIADVQRQLKGAGADRIEQFRTQIEDNILLPLTKEEEVMRQRVASEVRGLMAATATANSRFEEAQVSLRYPDIPAVSEASTLEELIGAYSAATAAIRSATAGISDLYSKELAAMDVLMGQEEVSPPVSASALLESNEFVGTMRLVAEEYWLNFHLRWSEPLEQKKAALLGAMGELRESVGPQEREGLDAIESVVALARPANSSSTLEAVRKLRKMLESIVSRLTSGADRVGVMLESLELRSVKGLKFESLNGLNEVNELTRKLESVGVDFDGLIKFLRSASGVFKSQSDAWATDRDNLLILAQYPVAKRVIAKMLESQRTLTISKLPYQRRPAYLYCQIYATGTPGVELDDESEALVMKD
jgi:hypothetical protein